MGFSTSDVLAFIQACASMSELADQATTGVEKIFSKNGESCDWRRRDRIR